MSEACVVGALGIVAILLAGALQAQEPRMADPMRPPAPVAGPAGSRNAQAPLRIEGIVVSSTRRLVLIAGEFLTEGDSIFGLRVERIEKHAVTLRDAARTFVLSPETAPPESAVLAGDPQ